MVRRREAKKREQADVTKKIFEKRYEMRDFSGQAVADILSSMARSARLALVKRFLEASFNACFLFLFPI